MATWKQTMLFGLTTRAVEDGSTATWAGAGFAMDPKTNSQRRSAGWSESVYWNADLPNRDGFEELCKRRAKLLPIGAAVIGQRYEQVVGGRGSQTGGKLFVGASGLRSDVPQMGLLCRVPGSSVANISKITLRGIPDARVEQGEYSPSQQFNNDLASFFSYLAGFSFKARQLDALQTDIGGIDTTGLLTFATTNPGFVLGDKVRVLRTKNADDRILGFAGTLGAVTSTTAQLQGWEELECTGGRLRKETTIYPTFTADFSVVRVVVRKVGRPFGGYVGRASKRRA